MKIVILLVCLLAFTQAIKFHAKISLDLYDSIKKDSHCGFQIIMKEKVDFNNLVHPITKKNLKTLDHKTKGRLIVNALQQVSAISQRPLIEQLKEENVKFQSLWISNSIVVEGNQKMNTLKLVQKLAQRFDILEIIDTESIKIVDDSEVVEKNNKVPSTRKVRGPGGLERTVQWNVVRAKGPELWEKGYSGKGVVVANIDTGITHTHVGLKDIYRGNKGDSYDHDFNWWDGVRSGSANDCPVAGKIPCDDHGHGTHCIGTQVGSDSNQYVGIAPGAQWLGCRSFRRGFLVAGAVESCMQFFLAPTRQDGSGANPDLRPDVISHSYGVPDNTALRRAFDASNAAGTMNVASAGNSRNCRTVSRIPGFYADSFTVGALAFQSDRIASFSSKGPGLSSHKLQKPEIAASGERVTSWGRNGGTAVMSGTSMSGPLVAGAVALLWDAVPELKNNLEATKKVLEDGADKVNNSECGTPTQTPNYVYGHGNLNILRSYELGKKLFSKKK